MRAASFVSRLRVAHCQAVPPTWPSTLLAAVRWTTSAAPVTAQPSAIDPLQPSPAGSSTGTSGRPNGGHRSPTAKTTNKNGKRNGAQATTKEERRKKHELADRSRQTQDVARVVPEGAYQSVTNVTPIQDFKRTFADAPAAADQKFTPEPAGRASSLPSPVVKVAGRVAAMRHMGKVMFLTIRSNNEALQVVLRAGDGDLDPKAVKGAKDAVTVGDVVAVSGVAAKTKHGELSLFATSMPRVVAPYVSTDLVTCPDQRGFAELQQSDLKYRYRFLDMLSSHKTVDCFVMRHKVLMSLRGFLSKHDFVEVETPTFHPIPGGAAAMPFVTRHQATDSDLYLRVAPELYLKQCVVGGMERVFEVGRVFRNEDADHSHNPEFTSCEFYQAYATYADLMVFTEQLLKRIAEEATGSSTVEVRRPDGTMVPVDFAKPFARVSVVPTLEERMGVTFPSLDDLDTPHGVHYLADLFRERNIPLPTVMTAAKLFDKLIDHYITDHVVEPTFVMDHPVFMSPLAKAHPNESRTSERFELFVNGMEMCNAYSELTDPVEQYKRFEQQMRQREMGDCETQAIDDTFLKALQVGLPPTAGWGMGVDRLCMLLSGSASIRDVIMFPLLRPDRGHDAKRRARTAKFFGFDHHMTSFVLRSLEAELERRGELRCCNQLRALRHTMETALRRHESGRGGNAAHAGLHDLEGPMPWPGATPCGPSPQDLPGLALKVFTALMCPPPIPPVFRK